MSNITSPASSLHTVSTTPGSVRSRGRWCAIAAVVGVVQGAALLAWPHQVDDDRFSFPMTAAWHVVAQATFFVQHLPLMLAVGTLATLEAVRRERLARRMVLLAAAGLGGLAVMELVAMSAARVTTDSSLGTTVNNLYSLPVMMTGIGLTVAGGVLVRRGTVSRMMSWLLVALGAFVFVGLTPALASGSFVAGRLAIMAWMVLFALFGQALQRID